MEQSILLEYILDLNKFCESHVVFHQIHRCCLQVLTMQA
jgi:hypothetical protein